MIHWPDRLCVRWISAAADAAACNGLHTAVMIIGRCEKYPVKQTEKAGEGAGKTKICATPGLSALSVRFFEEDVTHPVCAVDLCFGARYVYFVTLSTPPLPGD